MINQYFFIQANKTKMLINCIILITTESYLHRESVYADDNEKRLALEQAIKSL